MMAQVEAEARPLPEVRPDVPAEAWAVVAKMLAKKPDERYQTPKEVEQALRPFVTGGEKAGQTIGGKARAGMHEDATVLPGNVSKLNLVPSPSRMEPPAVPVEKLSPSILSGSSVAGGRGRRKKAKGKKPGLDWKVWVAGVAACLMAAVLCGAVVLTLKTRGGDTVVVEIDQADQGNDEPNREDRKQPLPKNLPPDPVKPPPPAGGVAENPLKDAEEKRNDKPAPKAGDFVRMFNGKDLKGWGVDSGDENAWQVRDGELVALGAEENNLSALVNHGFLLTERKYSDFVLRFQFQTDSPKVARERSQYDNAWGGVALRAVPHETTRLVNPAAERDIPCQMTVLVCPGDDTEGITGSLWWAGGPSWRLPPDNLATHKKVGEWNDMEIEMRGQALRLVVNGHVLRNVILNKSKTWPQKFPFPGLSRSSGRIGFLKRVGEVRYRNIEIKELSEEAEK